MVIRLPAMKHSRTSSSTQAQPRSPRCADFIRCGLRFTFCAIAAIPILVVYAVLRVKFEDWAIASLVYSLGFLAVVLVIWVGTFVACGLIIVPVGVFRFAIRHAKAREMKTVHRGPIWDGWMDGPEPL
jgi:hypothetical protein